MKTLCITIIGVLCLSMSVSAELRLEDLEKIREMLNESETRLEKRLSESEARFEKRLSEFERRFTVVIQTQGERITDLGKRIDFHGNLVIALIVAIIAFVAVPLAFIGYQYNRQRAKQDEDIRELREEHAQEIKALHEKIEALETKQIIRT